LVACGQRSLKTERSALSTRNIEKPSFTLANAKTFCNIPHEKLSLSSHACFTSLFFHTNCTVGDFFSLPAALRVLCCVWCESCEKIRALFGRPDAKLAACSLNTRRVQRDFTGAYIFQLRNAPQEREREREVHATRSAAFIRALLSNQREHGGFFILL
jgi:hypothetical protein